MVRVVLALVAAALVAAVHMAFLGYLVLGGFLALRRPALLWPHLASTTWAVYVTVTGSQCPLTVLEKWLLIRAGRTAYEGSFIGHYLSGTLYPAQYEIAVWLAVMVLVLGSYALLLARRRRPAPVGAA